MMNANRSDRTASGDGRYDFDRLERSVEYLIDEHRRLAAEREELLGELRDREHRVAVLEARVEAERALRASAVESVNKLLTRLEQMQSSIRLASEARS